MELRDYRALIDETDEQILKLFKKRMDISLEIARYKKEHGLPALDAAREREKLEDIGEKAGHGLRPYACELYTLLFEMSRARQDGVLNAAPEPGGVIANSAEDAAEAV